MTSQIEGLKTNEYLRRRKLRIQQVREQSKEIAKKIRQRAKVEQLRNITKLDEKKQNEYFQHQDQFVKKLEQIYVNSLKNFGTGHRNASDINGQDDLVDDQEKFDLSKKRGKDAAVELRRKKQEKLDQQKKLLDRKLHAREVANEISRDKSSAVSTKLQAKSSTKLSADNKSHNSTDIDPNKVVSTDKKLVDNEVNNVLTNDMATQWDFEEIPNEWELHIPRLSLPKDNELDSKDSVRIDSQPEKSKHLNLFALSEEMPSSLRGGLTYLPEGIEINRSRPSLTYVSEYLKNRGLHLRESDKNPTKKPYEDLQSIKETIQKTRSSRVEGLSNNVCHVADVQIVPVPSWQAQDDTFGAHKCITHKKTISPGQFKTVPNSDINKIFSSIRPLSHDVPTPAPVLRGSSPFRRTKVSLNTFSGKNYVDKPTKLKELDHIQTRKNPVTTYKHSTRDIKNIPRSDRKLVVRDLQQDEDAYSQAVRESSNLNIKDRDDLNKLQNMRCKVAVTKQNVEKEFKDTMAFLNSLPKDNSKPIKSAHMSEHRHKIHKECRQRKLQHEFKKVEKECNISSDLDTSKLNLTDRLKSQYSSDEDESFETRDVQYSWMPVPESDAKLAVHTIPTRVKERKSGNTVKFSKVHSYHEYRSRHKHTPPTKDTLVNDNEIKESNVFKNNHANSDSSSVSSDTSSVENLSLHKNESKPKSKKKVALTDAETIIIYKVLESKANKNKGKKQSKLIKDLVRSLSATEKESIIRSFHEEDSENLDKHVSQTVTNVGKNTETKVTFDSLNEGIYRTVKEQGMSCNIMSYYTTNVALWETSTAQKPWWNNFASLNVPDTAQEKVLHNDEHILNRCIYDKKSSINPKDGGVNWVCGDVNPAGSRSVQQSLGGSCNGNTSTLKCNESSHPVRITSAATSTSSYKTAVNNRTSAVNDGSVIKLLDEGGQEAGQFFIGGTGILHDNAYELVIQLRKKLENEQLDECGARDNPTEEQPETNIFIQANVQTETDNSDQNQKPPILPLDKPRDSKSTSQDIVYHNEQAVITDPHKIFNHAFSQTEDLANKQEQQQSEKIFNNAYVPKPAMSTCTQTSMDIPDQRYLQSSSTSTAYMSPPERILPGFCKKIKSGSIESERIEFQEEYCEVFEGCRCKKCSRARQIIVSRTSSPSPKVTPGRMSDNKLKTPPNTARTRSTASDGGYERINFIEANKRNINIYKRRRCGNQNQSKSNQYLKINKKGTISACIKKASPSSLHTNRQTPNKKSLNPIVKLYVDKLLSLNKKSLQAIEVMNEDCSSVTTPGSSIIGVPRNLDTNKPNIDNKISLEQIKKVLIQQILNEMTTDITTKKEPNEKRILPKKRSIHRVKSLNISKHLLNTSVHSVQKPSYLNKMKSSSSSPREESAKTSRSTHSCSPIINNNNIDLNFCNKQKVSKPPSQVHVFTKSDSDNAEQKGTSTQTSIIDHEANFMKLAENKLQNMEKIADLTEKCTKRLSNLAKVLEEVRKNKTLAYSQISDSASESDRKSDKEVKSSKQLISSSNIFEIKRDSNENNRNKDENGDKLSTPHIDAIFEGGKDDTKNDHDSTEIKNLAGIRSQYSKKDPNSEIRSDEQDENIRRNDLSKHHEITPCVMPIVQGTDVFVDYFEENAKQEYSDLSKAIYKDEPPPANTVIQDHCNIKHRGKPPPVLIKSKRKNDIEPHELSTVLEVDSPLSIRLKNQSSKNVTETDKANSNQKDVTAVDIKDAQSNPDLVQSNTKLSRRQRKISSFDSADDSKLQMMDLHDFNDIMLKPFISLREYAKQCNVGIEEVSAVTEVQRENAVNDELSSHSEASLPDVIAELLKRNVINEPFKFDSPSKVNSTTVSSESTLSMLALSKMWRGKKKSKVMFQQKENVAETSDTLSISSNPDLENAFKKMGLGWASSTLKKTKERLALSSSSNSSSTSTSQFKIKSSSNQDIPLVVSDSVSSVINLSRKSAKRKTLTEISRNAEQQTSTLNSMTVREFLTKELAKKITFTNKSYRDDTEEEFVSLFETKMPEEMRHSSQMVREERSIDSIPSGTNTRARTSTPVQLFKSMTYHSSSSSNLSNGLFSNAEDLSSVKGTSNSMKNHSNSDKDDLTIPECSLRKRKGLPNTRN